MQELLEALKERAGFFLLQMGEFKPFRVLLRSGEIVDTMTVYETFTENQIYDLLVKEVNIDLEDSDTKASAIVLLGQSDGYDIVLIEIFRKLRKKYQMVLPYSIKDGAIFFWGDLNKNYQTEKDW